MAKSEKEAQAALDEQVASAPEIPIDPPEEKETKLSKKEEKQAQALGIAKSRISMAGFKGKSDPIKLEKEEKRIEKVQQQRMKNRTKKAVAADNSMPHYVKNPS